MTLAALGAAIQEDGPWFKGEESPGFALVLDGADRLVQRFRSAPMQVSALARDKGTPPPN